MDELFTLYVHHGGYFDVNPQKYVGGEVGVVDDCDPDKWSKVEIESICREFGYTHVSRLWYRSPGDNEEEGDRVFQLIKDDHDAMTMTKLVRGHGQIHVYVEHPVYEPILINGGNGMPLDIVVEPDHDDPFVVSDSESCSSSELERSFDGYYNGQGYYASSGDNFNDDDDSDDGNDHWGDFFAHWDGGDAHCDGGSAGGRDGGRDGDEFGSGGARDAGDRNDHSDDEVEILECRRPGKEPIVEEPIVEEPQQDGAITTDSNDSSEDSDVEGARSMNPNQRYRGQDSASSDSEELMHMRDQMGDGVMNSDYTTEELLSLSESSSDGGFQVDGIYDSESDATVNETVVDNVRRRRKTFPVFRPVSNPDDLVFEKHMLFTSAKQFKEAITEYAVKGGWGVKFVKNDKVRVRAKCQPPCKFTAYLAKLPREMSWQLKTLNMEHTCTRSFKNPRCSANFLAKKLMKKEKPAAREKAQEFVDGSYVEQYNQLWDYCAELRRSSPGSTVLMKTHTFNEGELAAEMDLQTGLPYFERLYICWSGCKQGFRVGCRPIIGLDACHLKTKIGGQLMVAIARDPNEEYFPLAVAVVESETKDSWIWFINLLLADIGDEKRWTFISDQQKGLVQAFADKWPQYEHRICCRHLYNNLRKQYPGIMIRELFWKAAKATYAHEFERIMNEMKDIDEGAYNWLQGHTTTVWARHMFRTDALSDTIINNMCESFNSRILKFRGKPIISMNCELQYMQNCVYAVFACLVNLL
ncbi:hypothetical protein SO802_010537 [Lithocarpus litseifolius]|uniref:MULE transposase domain-containing protein n=1 Tax=Lithocarpus litseifolius TaxID=425828 RepID=A0AAW2DIB9_9ROSI